MLQTVHRMRCVLPGVLLALILFAAPAQANLGVGVNAGKITVEQKLVGGRTYTFPSIGVVNTGDTTNTPYAMEVGYFANQKQLRPAKGWFSFQPIEFRLNPKQVKMVQTRLTLPASAEPGKYFALLKAQVVPAKGSTAYGAAAATKLTFEVKETRSSTGPVVWMTQRAPWSYVALAGLVLIPAGIALGGRRKRV